MTRMSMFNHFLNQKQNCYNSQLCDLACFRVSTLWFQGYWPFLVLFIIRDWCYISLWVHLILHHSLLSHYCHLPRWQNIFHSKNIISGYFYDQKKNIWSRNGTNCTSHNGKKWWRWEAITWKNKCTILCQLQRNQWNWICAVQAMAHKSATNQFMENFLYIVTICNHFLPSVSNKNFRFLTKYSPIRFSFRIQKAVLTKSKKSQQIKCF